ncbi:uncharacterized protein PV07_11506 [Cladophialophora immunda]|uniref:Uncharacterized protein n=1 Tax=Cladophialophora immunda TaxID=569365 RepID=A0A0D1Z6M6_9EURO|nr:uncharacterized protein PV07_11506 [Cladophialophora immunda]KIW23296.1 hypothetical protein PV07_11506 [Cladophialophora immunda]OQV08424.1 hypothetical protein CLAIMM_12699 [Cladophialophora immunda]
MESSSSLTATSLSGKLRDIVQCETAPRSPRHRAIDAWGAMLAAELWWIQVARPRHLASLPKLFKATSCPRLTLTPTASEDRPAFDRRVVFALCTNESSALGKCSTISAALPLLVPLGTKWASLPNKSFGQTSGDVPAHSLKIVQRWVWEDGLLGQPP